MTGFIKGLFGSKKSAEPETSQQPKASEKKSDAFFLAADDAKTFGNIDYMRTAKKTRRTFPKTASSSEEQELVQEVSAMQVKQEGKNAPQVTTPTPALEASTTPQVDAVSERRKTDTSMDMFRNMARDIRR